MPFHHRGITPHPSSLLPSLLPFFLLLECVEDVRRRVLPGIHFGRRGVGG
jgi:hypothetical protein